MKKTIAIIIAASAISFAQAQQQATTAPVNQTPKARPTPELMAKRQSMHLQKALGLTEDQKQKVYQAVLTRTTSVETIRAKYGPDGDKKAMRAEVKPVRVQYVQTMNGILTPEQKTKWEEQRLRMKENRAKNNAQRNQAPSTISDGGGNGGIQKLTDEDDGIDD